MKTRTLLLLMALSTAFIFTAQQESRFWYFGMYAGLDFATSPPTALTNGQLYTTEGCASISDAAGNLQFYTDGITVYNRNHVKMDPNTHMLFGDGSTTQSGVIVKQPGNSNIFYVFTQAATSAPNGFCYSTIDLSLSAGLGSVTVQNTQLQTPSCEKICAVRHCNGEDVWVITHDFPGDGFRANLVTSSGVNSTAVISNVGTNLTTNSNHTLGQIKISPNGRKLGLVIYDPSSTHNVEIYDFDPATGVVSNPQILGDFVGLYGCEFSPDGTKFYAGSFAPAQLYQYDLCAGSTTAIIASKYTYAPSSSNLGALQLATDGKIYISRYGLSNLSEIQNPNVSGAGSNYVDNGVSIAPKSAQIGLPNFINSFFKQAPPPFTTTLGCVSATFNAPAFPTSTVSGCSSITSSVTGVTWNFGEPSSGGSNTGSGLTVSHTYSAAGTYTVKMIVQYNCSVDTVAQPVTIINNAPQLAVSGNFSICSGNTTTLTATGATTYSWSNGSQSSSIVVTPNSNAQYVVHAFGAGGSCHTYSIILLSVSKCTGLDAYENESQFRVFPNPTKGDLTIFSGSDAEVTVRNITGKTMMTTRLEKGEQKLDMSALDNGIYILHLRSADGWRIVRIEKLD